MVWPIYIIKVGQNWARSLVLHNRSAVFASGLLCSDFPSHRGSGKGLKPSNFDSAILSGFCDFRRIFKHIFTATRTKKPHVKKLNVHIVSWGKECDVLNIVVGRKTRWKICEVGCLNDCCPLFIYIEKICMGWFSRQSLSKAAFKIEALGWSMYC